MAHIRNMIHRTDVCWQSGQAVGPFPRLSFLAQPVAIAHATNPSKHCPLFYLADAARLQEVHGVSERTAAPMCAKAKVGAGPSPKNPSLVQGLHDILMICVSLFDLTVPCAQLEACTMSFDLNVVAMQDTNLFCNNGYNAIKPST